MEFFREAFIDKLQKTCDHSKVMSQSQASLRFLLRSRKIHLGGSFAFLGNEGILEFFALNAKILEIELNLYDYGVCQ